MALYEKDVEKAINKILVTKMKVNPQLLNDCNIDEKFTGRKFRFKPRDLVYLFCELKMTYNDFPWKEGLHNNKFQCTRDVIDLMMGKAH